MPLRCAILAAICAVDFAAMFKDMSITAGDLATKSYKSRKFFEFMESPWLSNTSRQTIKQSVSMFLHGSLSNLHFDLSWTMTLFLLYGETVALLRFFRFRVFPGSAQALTMFPQLKHLPTSVHPKPPATHGHFGLCSFVQLRTYSLSSDSFLPSQLHWNCMYFWNCNIYTSGYKSGLLCGTGIYQKHRKYPKLTYFSCFYSKCILFPSLVRHSHSLTWNFWNMNTWTLSILAC